MQTTNTGLSRIFRPHSIAIVGASADPIKPGGRALTELHRFGFSGRIYPVNNRRDEVSGIRCFPSISQLPEVVDLAIVAVPREAVVEAVEQCVVAGVGGVLIYSSGFAELDDEGAALQRELTRMAHSGSTRVVGPNCQGILDVAGHVSTSWADVFPEASMMVPGPVAWISQSGAVGAVAYSELRRAGLDINYWASTGNEADLTVEELIRHVIEDPGTQLVCGHVESIADPMAFRSTAARARELGKPLILLKGGMTPAGSQAARSHTGALVGDSRAYTAFFDQCGAILVRDLQSLVATASLFARYRSAQFGTRIAVIATSGGMGAIIADECYDRGFRVPSLAPQTIQRAREILPPFIRPANPIDVATGVLTNPIILHELIVEVERAGTHDQIVVCLTTLQSERLLTEVLDSIRAAAEHSSLPIALVLLACHERGLELARERGLVAFTETISPISGMAKLASWSNGTSADRPDEPHEEPAMPDGIPSVVTLEGQLLSERAAKARLEAHGLPVPKGGLVTGPELAVDVAQRVGWPVVAKLSSDRLAHKTELGAVKLGIGDEQHLDRAISELFGIAEAYGLPRKDVAVLIEETARPGVEMLVGLRKDPALGWLLVVGVGGELVEVMDDTAVRVLPVTRAEVDSMVRELRGLRLLQGVRGKGRHDIEAFVDVVLRVCELVVSEPGLRELELNPVRVHCRDGGVTILDALWISSETGATRSSDPVLDRDDDIEEVSHVG